MNSSDRHLVVRCNGNKPRLLRRMFHRKSLENNDVTAVTLLRLMRPCVRAHVRACARHVRATCGRAYALRPLRALHACLYRCVVYAYPIHARYIGVTRARISFSSVSFLEKREGDGL